MAKNNTEGEPPKPYVVVVSIRFVIASLVTACLVAFTIGTAARIILIEGPKNALLSSEESPMRVRADYHDNLESGGKPKTLPPPLLQEGKEMPKTIYTSKNFDTASSTASSLLIAKAKEETKEYQNDDSDWKYGDTTCAEEGGSCSRGKGDDFKAPPPSEPHSSDDDEEEHLPAGQHLLVDIKDIDGAFLNDEERLAQAMIDVVNDSRLTLLSYHCHALQPSGVSCAGVLLESHVSFHTWPEEGVITLDLFTCGAQPLLPVVPVILRLFGIPHQDGRNEKPTALWAHKQRGFRNHATRVGHLDSWDLGRNILGVMDFDMKKEVRLFTYLFIIYLFIHFPYCLAQISLA